MNSFFKGSLIKGAAAYAIKTFLTCCLSVASVCLSIMLKYQVSLKHVMFVSDSFLEMEMEYYFNIQNIAIDVLQGAPFIGKIPLVNEIFGTVMSYYTASNNVAGIQQTLFSDIIFFLISLAVFRAMIFIYSIIKRVCDRILGKGFLSLYADFASYLCIAYMGTISVLLIRDYFINNIYGKSDVLAFVVIVVAVILSSLVVSVVKNIKTPHKIIPVMLDYATKILIDCLFVSFVYMSVISCSVIMMPNLSGPELVSGVICAIVSLLIVTICFAVRFSKVHF